jgi:hypothetical protein
MSMYDLTNDTIEKLAGIGSASEFDERRKKEEAGRDQRMLEYALHMSGLGDEQIQHVASHEIGMTQEPEVLSEDENRSDAETALFFRDGEFAWAVYEFALSLGLVPGEVLFDDTIDPKYGLGSYAVRIEPIVKVGKQVLYYRLLDAVADYVAGPDLEAFDQSFVALYELFNPNHNYDQGKFSDLDRIKAAGKGSRSSPKEKKKKWWKGGKKGGWRMRNKKCGRAARKIGMTTRCWDGKEGSDFWAREDIDDLTGIDAVRYLMREQRQSSSANRSVETSAKTQELSDLGDKLSALLD